MPSDHTYTRKRVDDSYEYVYLVRTRGYENNNNSQSGFDYTIQPLSIRTIKRRLVPSSFAQKVASSVQSYEEQKLLEARIGISTSNFGAGWHDYLAAQQQARNQDMLQEMNLKYDNSGRISMA